MGPFGELDQAVNQTSDLLAIGRMGEDREAEGGLGDEDVAGHGLETRAGRIAAALVVAGHDHGHTLPADHRLGRTQDVAGGDQRHGHAVMGRRLAPGDGLSADGEFLAIAFGHDRQGLGRGQDGAMTGAGVIGVAMGDHRPVHRPDRIDIKIARRAVESRGCRAQQVLEADHGRDMAVMAGQTTR